MKNFLDSSFIPNLATCLISVYVIDINEFIIYEIKTGKIVLFILTFLSKS